MIAPGTVKREVANAVATLRRHGRLRGDRVLRNLPELPTLAEAQLAHIAKVLDACEGNKTRAALVLGIDRRTLYRKLRGEA